MLFELVRQTPIHTRVQVFPLEGAAEALEALRRGRITGAAVLSVAGALDEASDAAVPERELRR